MEINFTHNYNGKLFQECFGSVQLQDLERFKIGNQFTCMYNGRNMGDIIVVAVKPFLFKYITDVLSYIECGQPAHYLAELMRQEASGQKEKIDPMTILQHVIFSYTERNTDMHTFLLKEWWQAKTSPSKPESL